MNKRLMSAFVGGILTLSFSFVAAAQERLGFELDNFDKSVGPGEDFFRYANGGWLDRTEIPADKSNYGSFSILADNADQQLREIIEQAAGGNSPKGSDEQKAGDLYRSFMDEKRIKKLGLKPLRGELKRVEAIKSHEDLVRYIAHTQRLGLSAPFALYVTQDAKDSSQYRVHLYQAGLGLPDKDYYSQAKFANARTAYREYVKVLYSLAELNQPEQAAQTIMAIESRLAEQHWDKVKNRDPDATYNKYSIAQVTELTPNFAWKIFLDEAGLADIDSLIVAQPDFFSAVDRALVEIPLEDWKTYFRFNLLDRYAPYLTQPFVEANFNIYSKALSGVDEQLPRWKRAVRATEGALGEVLGRLYVERHFKPEAKQRMDELVANLRSAFELAIDELEWMGAETKEAAQEKLTKFTPKIGYPSQWKDYSALRIEADDLIGNLMRSAQIEYQRDIDRLGKPVDRAEWLMTPQTVNAYYDASKNEIVFPAAILQPPFFNVAADDAVNYGAIGAVIGHEFSHGFDDQGRKFDGDGNLREWWTEQDGKQFIERANGLVEQFNAFNPIDDLTVNGAFTLGENIGDLAGLTIAYKAYKLSLNGKEAPVIDGFSGDQRFFIGWAQIWQRKYRDDELRRRLTTDPHSPSRYRVNGIVANMPEFYSAFNIQPGDAMYLPPRQRVKIW